MYFIGIAVSNILSVVRHDFGHAVFPVISFHIILDILRLMKVMSGFAKITKDNPKEGKTKLEFYLAGTTESTESITS